jgi:putative membrane protein
MRPFKQLGALLAVLAVAPSFVGSAIAQQSRPEYYHYGPHMMWGEGYGWFLGPIVWLLFIVVAIIVVVLVLRWLGVSGGPAAGLPGTAARTPLDILKERFAKGEIDKKEYDERRKVLEQ